MEFWRIFPIPHLLYHIHGVKVYLQYTDHLESIDYKFHHALNSFHILFICSAFISLLAIYATISIEHFAFGELGLHPLYLSTIAWQFIGFTVLDSILLTLLSFGIGMLFRNAIVPLAFF